MPKKSLTEKQIDNLLEDAWLKIKVDEEFLFNPLSDIPDEFADDPHLYVIWLMQQPEYFYFTCQELLDIELLPMQCVILRELWNKKFPMLICARGGSKSFMLAVYAMLRMLFIPNRKIVICGAAYRQSRIIHNYMESIWKQAHIFRDLCSNEDGPKRDIDMCRFTVNGSSSMALPIGNGEKIRGQRANDIITDEFAAINREIFETVIAGFGSVRSNPTDNAKRIARLKLAKQLKLPYQDYDSVDLMLKDNQIVISGTADYSFKHFYQYFHTYREIIHNHHIKDEDEININLGGAPNPKDYSIIRIPVDLLPEGFMDEAMVARSKATVDNGVFEMEFGAVFSKDSAGFFKRTLIESCVCNHKNDIIIQNQSIVFRALLSGESTSNYIMAIDPASESDNFAIVILEKHKLFRKVVYCWTVTRKEHRELLQDGVVQQNDFYTFCIFKIRDLMKRFNIDQIMIDSGGGGITILEGLHDEYRTPEGENLIWPIIDYENPQPSDSMPGLHIIEMVNFSKSDWVAEANHGLKKDLENKSCLFPDYDGAVLSIAEVDDALSCRTYDTLSDCYIQIEELKNELATIVVNITPTGKERWDTPEVRLANNKKGRLRKDRYTALLMANMGARQNNKLSSKTLTPVVGGFSSRFKNIGDEKSYVGPDWFVNRMEGIYD